MKTWVRIVLVLGGVAAFLAFFVITSEQRQARMTAQATGSVTGVEFDEDDESSSLNETDIRYTFDAGGTATKGETSRPGDRTRDFAPGTKVTVCYNPKDISESDIAEGAQARCG